MQVRKKEQRRASTLSMPEVVHLQHRGHGCMLLLSKSSVLKRRSAVCAFSGAYLVES